MSVTIALLYRTVPERVAYVKGWMIDNINRQTMEFPDEDRVWNFITTTWATVPTETAEKILCQAMANIPHKKGE